MNKKLLIIEFDQYDEERYFQKKIFALGYSNLFVLKHLDGDYNTKYYISIYNQYYSSFSVVGIIRDFYLMLHELKENGYDDIFELYIENYLMENNLK